MARNRLPSYRLHRASGQAVVTLNGKDHYLGRHGTEASRRAYDHLTGRWVGGGRVPLDGAADGATVNELLVRFWRHADGYYRKHGRATSKHRTYRAVCGRVRELAGEIEAAEFTPTRLKEVRASWVAEGASRNTVNEYASLVRSIFRWGVEHEIVPGPVHDALRAVAPLAAGRSAAPETAPVRPVPDEALEGAVAVMSARTAAMVRLQVVTGMRPSEACQVRGRDLDRTGDVWVFTPASHKTEHHGRSRSVAIGPKGQAIVGPWLEKAGAERFAFGGDEPRNVNSYRNSITAACRRAKVEHWAPNQLRHNYATMIRKAVGLDAAQLMLDHSSAKTTEIYAELDAARKAEIAARFG